MKSSAIIPGDGVVDIKRRKLRLGNGGIFMGGLLDRRGALGEERQSLALKPAHRPERVALGDAEAVEGVGPGELLEGARVERGAQALEQALEVAPGALRVACEAAPGALDRRPRIFAHPLEIAKSHANREV